MSAYNPSKAFYSKSVVRDSKFRQIIVEGRLPEQNYPDLSTSEPSTTGEILSCSGTHLAFVNSNGTDIQTLSLKTQGKRLGGETFGTLKGHTSGPVWDLNFSPLDYSLLASGGSDSIANVWRVENESPVASLQGDHGRTVSQVRWHPTSSGVLATSSYSTSRIWDVEANTTRAVYDARGSDVTSFAWDYCGARAAVASLDKTVHLLDPRDLGSVSLIKDAHGMMKSIAVEWASEHVLFSTGVSSTRDREIAVWDSRNSTKALARIRIDSNTGLLKPLFDVDTQLMFLTGHGDMAIRVYEFDDSKTDAAMLAPIGNFSPKVAEGARSICLLPKPALDVMECEVARVMRLCKSVLEGVKVEVPRRKAYRDFQDDIFPDTRAPVPAQSASEYFGNQTVAPVLAPVKSLVAGPAASSANVVRAEAETTQPQADAAAQTEADEAETERLIEKSENLDKRFSKFLGYSAKMKFSKLNQSKTEVWTSLAPEVAGSDTVFASNAFAFAAPWKHGGGGPIFIGDLSTPGRCANPNEASNVLRGGHSSPVTALAFAEFDERVLVSGSDDCTLRLWRLPSFSEFQADQVLASSTKFGDGHRMGIRGISFSRVASNLVATFAVDSEIKIWDVSASTDSSAIDLSMTNSSPSALDWSYDGALLASGTRDGSAYIFDPRSAKSVVQNWAAHDGAKGTRVAFLGQSEAICTTGFGKTGDRQFRMWDLRNLSRGPMSTMALDTGAGIVSPTYIEDNGVLLLAAKGEHTIRVYEIEGLSRGIEDQSSTPGVSKRELKKYELHKCAEFRCSGEPSAGWSFLPRRYCDVDNSEWAKAVRLSTTNAEICSFTVPRAGEIDKYFADDLFPPAVSGVPAIDASAWLKSSGGVTLATMDLNKSGKTAVSKRPKAELIAAARAQVASSDRMRKELAQKEAERTKTTEAMDRMQRLAVQHEMHNPNLSKPGIGHDGKVDSSAPVNTDVAEDEW